MNTKIVYVLTSTTEDIYLEQAIFSIYSLRKTAINKPHIVLLTDSNTKNSFIENRAIINDLVDEFVIVDAPPKYTSKMVSRMLKTNMRKHINGDFLYIDTDTLILKPLDEIENYTNDIMAVCDLHAGKLSNSPSKNLCCHDAKILGWALDLERCFFNGGVFYVKDNKITHDFFNRWNENWEKCLKKGISTDQSSLAKTNAEFNYIIRPLPNEWNCMGQYGVRYINDAKIFHYLCTIKVINGQSIPPHILNSDVPFLLFKKSGEIPQIIDDCIEDPLNGFAEITQIISGNDVAMYQDTINLLLKKYYGTNFYKRINNLLDFLIKIKNIIRLK